jgi:asparagine synthase (glutamine-hydrolysing)
MCGITGIFNLDRGRRINRFDLEKMNNSLIHRGPDGEGFFIENNVGLAHRRLEIIDLETGEQPMFSYDNDIVLVFNGEIYNFLDLKKVLINRGHKFRTNSDTEVIIESYREWGVECQNKFNGMWSFALWSKSEQRLFLSRDRIGEKPLYYTVYNNSIFFGSEMKSLFAANVPKEINEELTELYLTLSYIPSRATYYKNIFEVLPGHFLLINTSGINEYKYWDLPDIDESKMDNNSDAVNEEFTYLLEDSVKIRMNSHVPFGAFLSGGLDSASIVSLMSKNSELPIETFTIGFNESKYDESILAQLVANKFLTNHNLGYVDSQSMEYFIDKITTHFDEPFGDNSTIPTFQVSNFASKKVKMVLTGDGGDEVMSGYPSYLGLKYFNIYNNLPEFTKNCIVNTLKWSSNFLPSKYNKRTDYLYQLARSADMNFVDYISSKKPVTQLSNIKNITKNIKNVVSIEDYLLDFEKEIPYKDNFYKNMYFDLKNRLPYGYLAKVDRMSMANSLETRAPFLDHRLIECMTKVDKGLKVQNFQTKSILKNTVAKTLPAELLKAKKMGFVAPLDIWLRGKFADEMLDDLKSFDWSLSNKFIDKMITDNEQGVSDNGSFLWQLLILKQHY